MSDEVFRVCSTCRKPIGFGATWYRCSVSTCNRPRLGLFFCSVPCWEAHVPEARHRDAWAEQERAPSKEQAAAQAKAEESAAPTRRVVTGAPGEASASAEDSELPKEVLVVVSKLKAYVKAKSTMSTSDGVVDVLSEHLRWVMTEAIKNAARDGRKTVLDRDVTPVVAHRRLT